MNQPISLHLHSPSWDEAIKRLEQLKADQFRFLSVRADGRYAAKAWKRLFLLALRRMQPQQPNLARLTAIEGLVMFSQMVCSSTERDSASQEELKEIEKEFVQLEQRSQRFLRGATTPRLNGLHSEILCHRYEEAQLFFLRLTNNSRKLTRENLSPLWRQWGGATLPEKTHSDEYSEDRDFLEALNAESNPKEKSILLLATSLNSTKHVVRNALSRAGALRARPGYCVGCKFRPAESGLTCCSICWTRASSENAFLQ